MAEHRHRATVGSVAREVKVGWPTLSDAAVRLLVETIEGVSRELSRSVPPMRGAPFYALDYAPGDLTPLDVFCSRGIFRKYEHALHLGSSLGAPARWWATHFGCTVLGVDSSPALAWAANRLTARARLQTQVQCIAADAAALPVRERYFTHVWAGDALRSVPDPPAALREAWRVLRPGAQFALRVGVSEVGVASATSWCQWLAGAGFVEIVWQPASHAQLHQVAQLARRRLDRWLSDLPAASGGPLAAACTTAYDVAMQEDEIALIFARRPA